MRQTMQSRSLTGSLCSTPQTNVTTLYNGLAARRVRPEKKRPCRRHHGAAVLALHGRTALHGLGVQDAEVISQPGIAEHVSHSCVERRGAAKGGIDYLQHVIPILRDVATAPLRIEILERVLNHLQILVFEVLAEHDLKFEVPQLAAHVHKGKDLKDAPQPGQVGRPAEHDELAATAEKHWQAPQVFVNAVLVDATF